MSGKKGVGNLMYLKIQGWLKVSRPESLCKCHQNFDFSWLCFLSVSFIFSQALSLGGNMTVSISELISYLLNLGKRISTS